MSEPLTPLAETVDWLAVGEGRRSHAFMPGELRYAYCSVGPGRTDVAAPPDRCVACVKRLERMAAQERELLVNWE